MVTYSKEGWDKDVVYCGGADTGRDNRPAGHGGGAARSLCGGLAWILLWIATGSQSA